MNKLLQHTIFIGAFISTGAFISACNLSAEVNTIPTEVIDIQLKRIKTADNEQHVLAANIKNNFSGGAKFELSNYNTEHSQLQMRYAEVDQLIGLNPVDALANAVLSLNRFPYEDFSEIRSPLTSESLHFSFSSEHNIEAGPTEFSTQYPQWPELNNKPVDEISANEDFTLSWDGVADQAVTVYAYFESCVADPAATVANYQSYGPDADNFKRLFKNVYQLKPLESNFSLKALIPTRNNQYTLKFNNMAVRKLAFLERANALIKGAFSEDSLCKLKFFTRRDNKSESSTNAGTVVAQSIVESDLYVRF